MKQADAIRRHAWCRFIQPAFEAGEETVTIRAGDVHDSMRLSSKAPAVCGALGTNKFQEQYRIRLIRREGPTYGFNAYFTFSKVSQRCGHGPD